MTYAVGGTIQAADYNGLASNNSPNVNLVWSTGTGDSGYGQPTIPDVQPSSIIFATQFADLNNAIITSGNHQGTTLDPFIDPMPVQGNLIRYEPNMVSNIDLVYQYRLNAALQGSTSTTTATTTSSWNQFLQYTFTVAFADHDSTRYFFNAGGQVGFNFLHPFTNGANIQVNNVCTDTGTVWLSSPTSGTANLVGTNYNGITKIGGGNPTKEVINTNAGFYALTGSAIELFRQNGTSPYYYYYSPEATLKISGSYDGAGTLTLTVLIDGVTGAYYYYGLISAGTQANLVLRPPSTTYLDNSWGTPTVGYTISSS